MRRFNIKIKSTGFGFFPFFFPIFLAAFVEQDEKSMNKASVFQQKAVLAAGTFANILTALVFFLIMIWFFSFAFVPSGIVFDNYAYGVVELGGITAINNIQIKNPSYQEFFNLIDEEKMNTIKTKQGDYLIEKEFLDLQQKNQEYILAYIDAPAVKNNLTGAIMEIDGEKIENIEDLGNKLKSYSSGDEINIKTSEGDYLITLEEHPSQEGEAWIGISFENREESGVFRKVVSSVSSFKKPHVYYSPKFATSDLIYNFLWWLVIISFSVALVNMLPMGIFDGGRFFYLTILGITKSENKAKRWFSWMTNFLLLLLLVMMIFWVISFV